MLCAAVEEIASGLIEADLGGHVLKKRVALAGRGKSGGARVLIARDWPSDGSSCTDLRRTSAARSMSGNWRPCR
jgi:hypothetical protein